jgi:hypothetical protein
MADELNNQLVSARDSGSYGHYGSNACVTDLVNAYLIDGVLPSSRSGCAADPRPDTARHAARGIQSHSDVGSNAVAPAST